MGYLISDVLDIDYSPAGVGVMLVTSSKQEVNLPRVGAYKYTSTALCFGPHARNGSEIEWQTTHITVNTEIKILISGSIFRYE